jgi:hypothetical protein
VLHFSFRTQVYSSWLWASGAVDVALTLVCFGSSVLSPHHHILIFLLADATALWKRLGSSGPSPEISRSVFRIIVFTFVRTAASTAVLAAAAAITAQVFGTANLNTLEISYSLWEPLAPLYAISTLTTLSVGDNVVHRLSDPTIRRTNGSNQLPPSLLPQFVVSTPRSGGGEEEEMCGAPRGLMKGVMVKVEREEEVCDGSKVGESRRTSMQ